MGAAGAAIPGGAMGAVPRRRWRVDMEKRKLRRNKERKKCIRMKGKETNEGKGKRVGSRGSTHKYGTSEKVKTKEKPGMQSKSEKEQ